MFHQAAKPEIKILGDFDRKQLFCAGSISKMLTTFVVLSFLSEKFELEKILDDEMFLDEICRGKPVLGFLQLFQKKIGGQFTIRDLCTFHTGLPYTFDPTEAELENVIAGGRFTHQSVMDEKAFLSMCENNITMIHQNRQKFHYSEISIMVLGYLIEKAYGVRIEDLYTEFLTDKFNMSKSLLSRTRPEDAYYKDLSGQYDYACMALPDYGHGYFCYGNGFYTTLDDLSAMLSQINFDPVFQLMIDVKSARRAEDTVMNGVGIELLGEDLCSYEGMSFSGCTSICYSRMKQKWCIKFGENAESDFQEVCTELGYPEESWGKVPDFANVFYAKFTSNYEKHPEASIPLEYQGNYRRVKLNEGPALEYVSVLGNNYLEIRDPGPERYDLVQVNDQYHLKDEDDVKDSRIGLFTVSGTSRFLFYNGNLYQRDNEMMNKQEKQNKASMM